MHEVDISKNQHTKGTCLEAMYVWGINHFIVSSNQNSSIGLRVTQLWVIFTLPEHLCHPHLPNKLVYVKWFTQFRAPHPDDACNMNTPPLNMIFWHSTLWALAILHQVRPLAHTNKALMNQNTGDHSVTLMPTPVVLGPDMWLHRHIAMLLMLGTN